jgi:hypothetical protein
MPEPCELGCVARRSVVLGGLGFRVPGKFELKCGGSQKHTWTSAPSRCRRRCPAGSVAMQTSDATRILVSELLQYEAAATANLQEQRRQAAGVLADLPELATRFETQASAISINAAFLRSIVSEMGLVGDVASAELDSLGVVELTVDGMMKQLVREWTDAGAAEREQCLGFVLSSLERHVPISGGSPPQVVIPGAGLGRLVWEVAMRGYAAVGIERAMSMMLCGSYVINHLLSHERTGRIQPYAAVGSGPCNVESAANVGREFCVPDADAAKRFASATAEADATAGLQHPHERLQVITGDFRAVARASGPCADAVLTTFLLDACGDVVGALETVHAQLKPGGVWINLGPLEYEGTAGYHASRKLRLCADELVQVRIPWPPSTVPRLATALHRPPVTRHWPTPRRPLMTPCGSSCASAASKYSRRARASDATTRRISSPCSRATSIASSSSRASTSGLQRRRGHHPSHLGPGAPESKCARRRRDPCSPLPGTSKISQELMRNRPKGL